MSEFDLVTDPVQTKEMHKPEFKMTPAGNLRGGGSLFVYDLETVPDESRYPRPEKKKIKPQKLNMDAVAKTVGTIKDTLKEGITPEQAEEVLLSERDRDKPRSGAIDALESYIARGDQEMQAWHKLSVSPWHCRIVAMGTLHYMESEPESWIAKTHEDECDLLRAFWIQQEEGRRAGYNILGFDDLVITARSMILGINPGKAIDLRKYNNKQAVDLMTMMFPGGNAMKLKSLCYAIGIIPPAGNIDGSQVLEMVDDGRWDDLRMYVESDVMVEMDLLRRVQKVVEI